MHPSHRFESKRWYFTEQRWLLIQEEKVSVPAEDLRVYRSRNVNCKNNRRPYTGDHFHEHSGLVKPSMPWSFILYVRP